MAGATLYRFFPRYRDRKTERFCKGEFVKEFQGLKRQAERRLAILEAAEDKTDLMKLASNNFEALRGDRQGHYSIRINLQWRICFEWPDDQKRPVNIEIVDYH